MRQKLGYPNLSVKLYETIEAWEENRFIELAATITTLTLRDSIFGRNEGMLQFYDSGSLHTKTDGEHIVTVSVCTANTNKVQNRVYSTKYSGVSVDAKGDNIISIQLQPLHHAQNLKFSRVFFSSAEDSVAEMMRVLYKNHEALIPKINAINVFMPRTVWTSDLETYMQYIREVGISVDNESFTFVYEDFNGFNITDWKTIVDSEAKVLTVGDPKTVGEYAQDLKFPLAYNFVWNTKHNSFIRKPNENITYYTYSPNTRKIERITVGDGINSAMMNRSGGYSEMTYANGYEEATRLQTVAQYDSYASCQLAGNFDIYPGQKLFFKDIKDQFKTYFFVDEVIHEISQNDSVTTLYVFTHSKDLREVDLVKVKSTALPDFTGTLVTDPETGEVIDSSGESGPSTSDGYEWDLNKLSASAIRRASGRSATGDCARYVRYALQDADLKHRVSGGLGHANQMGSQLINLGWNVVGQNLTQPQKGDIAIFQRTNSKDGAKYGHVCIFTGNKWVSDFIQSSVQPNSKSKLPYTVYRAKNGYK